MVNVSKFVKNHIPLCVCTLGIVILGYLGYHVIRWVINKCSKTEKTDGISRSIINFPPPKASSSADLANEYWWTKITGSKEFNEFKKNWRNLAKIKVAREEAKKLQSSYRLCGNINVTSQSIYDAPLGTVYVAPGNFSMWMPGVALVASYLAEKKKIDGLFVCQNLESLSTCINEINLNPSNQRYAFVVGAFQSGFKKVYSVGFEQNFPQHKVTVCVEKKDAHLTIALLDAEPDPGLKCKEISPENLVDELWGGYDQWYKFNAQELVFRAILNACRSSKCRARLLHSQVLRQKSYGCEVFALQDAVAYLRDPDFFDRIICSKETVKIDQQYEIEIITTLPSEFMVGAQSSKIVDDYRKKGGQFDKILLGKKKTLQNYLDSNLVDVSDRNNPKKNQNHYITKKSFKYLKFAVLSLKALKSDEITKIINKTLIK